MTPKYKVSRAGNTIGNFTLWEIKEWIQTGKLDWTDDFWTEGMKEWAKLEVIRKHVLSAEKPSASPGQESYLKPPSIDVSSKLPAIGLLIFFVGAAVMFLGIIHDPDGSAIRQEVLMQQITNGILLMILGVLIAKK
jgi:hypothetical protein